jgi:putative membrane protein
MALAASPARAHAQTYSALDAYLLRGSIQGDRFEIGGGKLAEAKGATPAVRALGARLVKDHSASLKDAKRVARRLGISIPPDPTPSQEWELQTLDTLSGTTFDVGYTKLEIQDHKQDIEDQKTELRHGTNASVRHLAKTDLPTLRTHLKLSKEALTAALGG